LVGRDDDASCETNTTQTFITLVVEEDDDDEWGMRRKTKIFMYFMTDALIVGSGEEGCDDECWQMVEDSLLDMMSSKCSSLHPSFLLISLHTHS
jgi:hypothetical protein